MLRAKVELWPHNYPTLTMLQFAQQTTGFTCWSAIMDLMNSFKLRPLPTLLGRAAWVSGFCTARMKARMKALLVQYKKAIILLILKQPQGWDSLDVLFGHCEWGPSGNSRSYIHGVEVLDVFIMCCSACRCWSCAFNKRPRNRTQIFLRQCWGMPPWLGLFAIRHELRSRAWKSWSNGQSRCIRLAYP